LHHNGRAKDNRYDITPATRYNIPQHKILNNVDFTKWMRNRISGLMRFDDLRNIIKDQ